MAKISWPGSTLLAPVPPALVTCGSGENANLLTIAWTGILNSKPPRTYISVRPERYSFDLIRESGEFVIHLPTAAMAAVTDTCGVISGRQGNKFEKCGLQTEPARVVNCPLLCDAPLALECRVTQVIPMETHHVFIADIVAVDVEDSLVDAAGKLHLEKADLLAYAHGDYFSLGKRLGKFGFSVQKKKKPRKK